jgi:predicted phage terminase large subunit-like protein
LELFRDFASGNNVADAAPRGHAKTTIGSCEVMYRIVNALNHYSLVISDTYSQARDIVDNIRGELESNHLVLWVYGDLTTDWHWTSGSFTTANNVRVTARGSNMKVRGLKFRHWRPDFALIDDLENDEAVMKPERRDKLLKWMQRAVFPAMARREAQICMVGTVLHADSLLNNALNGLKGFAGWTRHRWAALNQNEDGTLYSLWPAAFPVQKLVRIRDDPNFDGYFGPIAFAQEMQNEAIDDSSRVIKSEWILGTPEKPHTYSLTQKEEHWAATHEGAQGTWLKNEIRQIIMAVDPAISEKTTADYFAIFVIGVDKAGEIWELDKFRDRIQDIDVQVAKILEFNGVWKPDRIKVESVAYQAGLARAVQKAAAKEGKHAPIFKVTPDKDKYRRAVLHSANFAGGLVHLRTDHPLFDAFVKEILDFPMGEHDDMFDAYMHSAEDLVQKPTVRTFAHKPAGF